MKANAPTVLFCPAHYVFDGTTRGSELSWAYHVADGLASTLKGSVVVTGFSTVKSKKTYSIIELQKNKTSIDLSLLNSLLFNVQYSFYGAFQANNELTIHHHVLPFMIGTTFNLFWILGLNFGRKKIIGPLQTAIPEYADNVHDFNAQGASSRSRSFSKMLLSLLSSVLNTLSYRTLRLADGVIVIDQRTHDMLVSRGIKKERITIIPPGIDVEKFLPAEHRRSHGQLKLLTVSYLIDRKRVELLLHALALVVKEQKNVHLSIVGTGPQQQRLTQLVEELKLNKNVTFHGFIENQNVASLYSEADIFITASAHESWGQMYLEAMSSGLPIISTRNFGAENIIRKDFGLLTEATPEDLTKAILSMARDHDKMIRMGKKARQTAVKSYDWKKVIIPRYMKLYQSLQSH